MGIGIDVQVEDEDGRPDERLDDSSGSLANFLFMVDSETTKCLQFIDPYGYTIFNTLQIPVLEAEITAALQDLAIDRLVVLRRQRLAAAERLHWQPEVIEELRRSLGTDVSHQKELNMIKLHMTSVLKLLARARAEGPHKYVRFAGD